MFLKFSKSNNRPIITEAAYQGGFSIARFLLTAALFLVKKIIRDEGVL